MKPKNTIFFLYNKTPKAFCETFGVYRVIRFFYYSAAFSSALASGLASGFAGRGGRGVSTL